MLFRSRVKCHLGLTDYTNSVGPILVIRKIESWSSKLDGTDCDKDQRDDPIVFARDNQIEKLLITGVIHVT